MSEVDWQRAMIERLQREGLRRYLSSAERAVCAALVQRFERTGELSPRSGRQLADLLERAVSRRDAPRRRLYAVRGEATETNHEHQCRDLQGGFLHLDRLCTKSPVREMTRWSMRPSRSVFKTILRSDRSK